MNPTQNQDNHGPEHGPTLSGAALDLVGLLTNGARFRAWLARSVTHASPQPVTVPDEPDQGDTVRVVRRDTDPLPDVVGVCDYCGTPNVERVLVTGDDGWSNPRMVCANPALCAGYAVTDAGRAVLDESPAGEAPGSVPQVLRGAALYLERHGWTQHAYYDPTATIFTPAADMVGAIAMVCYGGPCDAPAHHFDHPGFLDFEEAVLHLDRYLLVENGSQSYEFNDARGRQAADVIRVLRDAATRTCDELIDALRAIDQSDEEVAARLKLLTPGGIWAEPADQPTRAGYGRR